MDVRQDLHDDDTSRGGQRIAIVGLSCRVPGAEDASELWLNVIHGRETVQVLERASLLAAGHPESLLNDPGFVPAKGVLRDAECFDAGFFGISNREATLLDPQHRIFLEQAWIALENAGYGAVEDRPCTGVFASAAFNTYLTWLLQHGSQWVSNDLSGMLGNAPDYLATRTAFKLGLKGPAVTVQTACSSSLAAVHLAALSLTAGECELALAGGITVRTPQLAGHVHQEGSIFSVDGHCRPFDAEGTGAVNGCGVGVVVLKRLEDAVADGDTIHAVILGSAINNDGSDKQAFTAPNPQAQASVIAQALQVSGLSADDIDYIEAHGTGTRLGDAIEIGALSEIMQGRRRPCYVGSLKANIGHLDAAAGVVGLIKTVLALQHRRIPPQINFRTPSPACGFEKTCLSIGSGQEWPRTGALPRAAVSSFGFGGTNVHVVLEAAPERALASPGVPPVLICLQARSEAAVRRLATSLSTHLVSHPELDIADVAYTLQAGRAAMPFRVSSPVHSLVDAVSALRTVAERAVIESVAPRALLLTGTYISSAVERLLHADPIVGPALRSITHRSASRVQSQEMRAFCAEAALVGSLLDTGLRPHSLICQGIGIYSALVAVGSLTVEEAVRAMSGYRGNGLTPEHSPRHAIPVHSLNEHTKDTVPVSSWVGLLCCDSSEARAGSEGLLTWLGRAWSAGIGVDWEVFHGGLRRHRVPLPGYPFERQKIPLPAQLSRGAQRGPLEPWCLWRQSWQRADERELTTGLSILLVHHADELSTRLAGWLSERTAVHEVRAGTRLDRDLLERHSRIVYVARVASARAACDPQRVAMELEEMLELARNAGSSGAGVDLVTTGAFDVSGADCVSCHSAAAAAFSLVMRQEGCLAHGRVLDVDCNAVLLGRTDLAVQQIGEELLSKGQESLVACRGRHRWIRELEALGEQETVPFAGQATYLLTGGTGGVGRVLARQLARLPDVRLALLSRSAAAANVPSLGAELGIDPNRLMLVGADVTDRESLAGGIAKVCDRFGRLDGVFHLAGENAAGTAATLTAQTIRQALAPKLVGAEALVSVLEQLDAAQRPRFVMLVSSLAALVGGPGQGAYAAANAALEAFVAARVSARDMRVLAVALDRLPGVGMARAGELGTFSLSNWPWLETEHRIDGRAILPGSVVLALMLHALAASRSSNPLVHAEEIVLLQAAVSGPVGTAVIVQSAGASEETHLAQAHLQSAGSGRQLLAKGRFPPASAAALGRSSVTALAARCPVKLQVPALDFGRLVLGPRWGCLKELRGGTGEWLAELEIAVTAREDRFPGPVHPALLDVALGAALAASDCVGYAPVAYRGVTIDSSQPFPTRIFSHITGGRLGTDRCVFAVVLMDPGGRELAHIESYELQRVEFAFAAAPAAAKMAAAPGRLAQLSEGLDPAILSEALAGALAATTERLLLVSSGDLPRVVAGARAPREPVPPPEVILEAGVAWSPERMASLVGEVLGLASSGPDDDFFALGGDSILALEVVSRVNATRRRGTPALSSTDLYGHSTPRRLAAYLQTLQAAQIPRTQIQQARPADAEFGLNQAAYTDLVTQLSAAHSRS